MAAVVQIVILLVQVFPSAIKAIQAWQDYHGAKLTRERRQQLAGDIRTAVQSAVDSKDMSGIFNTIKNLGRPQKQEPQTTDDPKPQNPSS